MPSARTASSATELRCLACGADRTAPTADARFYFCAACADLVVDFFAECLVHVKGEFAGRPFVLEPWQRDDFIRPVFGTRWRHDGTRRYRTAYLEVPKKNGKSSLGAGLGLYLLCADGEAGAEVYSAAADTEQAAIVFDVAKQMRTRSAELRKRLKPYKRALVYLAGASTYKVISADADTKHGFNAHGLIFDELHAQPNRKLWDTLTTGVAARRQPLTVAITTAGYDKQSICWEQHEYARKVRDGILEDAAFFPLIYAAPADADWRDRKVWALANPGLGVSLKLDYLEAQEKKALDSLAYQNTFRRLHLNQWTAQATRAIDMDRWNAAAWPVDPAALTGRLCFGGLDLASSQDVAAYVLLFPPVDEGEPYQVLTRLWIPSANIARRVTTGVPYDVWVQQGLIEPTEGNVIDYDVIRARIRADFTAYRILELAYDRWGAVQLATQLQGDGLVMVPISQGYAGMAAATQEFLALLADRRLAHGGHPVLRWMASNFAVKQSAEGYLRPDKHSASEKIDGIVALIMALARVMAHAGRFDAPAPSDALIGPARTTAVIPW